MTTVFITREVDTDGPLYAALTDRGWALQGCSLIEFSAEPVTALPQSDWLFFYSKNGVRFLLSQVSKDQLRTYRLAAIGKGTAAMLEAYDLHVAFTGTGKPESTARAFERAAAGSSVTFVQARHSKRSVESMLSEKVTACTLIVYNNVSKKNAHIPKADLYIFTSPLNVEAFAAQHAAPEPGRVLAIGPSTARAIEHIWKFQPVVSEAPDEESLAKSALGMYPFS
jgi:uroporphyrinogen-III synthase